jgi:hypothetical protein
MSSPPRYSEHGAAGHVARPGRDCSSRPKSPCRDNDKLTVKSDAAWRAIAALAVPRSGDQLRRRQASRPGGACPASTITAWPKLADEVQRTSGRRWWPARSRRSWRLRYPVLRIEGLPSRTLATDGRFRVVFDRVLSAYPTIKVRGGKGAAQLTIAAHQQATMLLGEGEQYFEFPIMTEIVPGVHRRSEERHRPRWRSSTSARISPRSPSRTAARSQCSDERLNRIWQASRWAVQSLPPDPSPRLAEPPGADQRSGRLPDRVDGEPLRLRPAVA